MTNQEERMRFIDLFAGIGGFRYGLQQVEVESKNSTNSKSKSSQHGRCPFRCVWSNEYDKYASQIYEKNFCDRKHSEKRSNNGGTKSNTRRSNGKGWGSCSNCGREECSGIVDTRDIRTVKSSEIPDHDLLCAGFPCQSFSVAGKRKGFEDTRGTLFFEIARIARDKRPRYLLLENVKGLLSHDQGKTFQTILEVLSDLGYRTEWQVLNSKHFGVPQNRERVFIVGHLGKESGRQVFPVDGVGMGKKNPAVCLTKRGYGSQRNGTYVATHSETKIRHLTPTECERLQGFPDRWTENGTEGKISDTQRYKVLGNAVTINVITAIGKKLYSSGSKNPFKKK